jgi:hypothetical protein
MSRRAASPPITPAAAGIKTLVGANLHKKLNENVQQNDASERGRQA